MFLDKVAIGTDAPNDINVIIENTMGGCIKTVEDLPTIQREQIQHFFTHYKDLEKGKWAKILGWQGVDRAKELISEGIERANKKVAA